MMIPGGQGQAKIIGNWDEKTMGPEWWLLREERQIFGNWETTIPVPGLAVLCPGALASILYLNVCLKSRPNSPCSLHERSLKLFMLLLDYGRVKRNSGCFLYAFNISKNWALIVVSKLAVPIKQSEA